MDVRQKRNIHRKRNRNGTRMLTFNEPSRMIALISMKVAAVLAFCRARAPRFSRDLFLSVVSFSRGSRDSPAKKHQDPFCICVAIYKLCTSYKAMHSAKAMSRHALSHVGFGTTLNICYFASHWNSPGQFRRGQRHHPRRNKQSCQITLVRPASLRSTLGGDILRFHIGG